jgi:hypothetical protein
MTNRIGLFLFGIHNRTFGPYLAAKTFIEHEDAEPSKAAGNSMEQPLQAPPPPPHLEHEYVVHKLVD